MTCTEINEKLIMSLTFPLMHLNWFTDSVKVNLQMKSAKSQLIIASRTINQVISSQQTSGSIKFVIIGPNLKYSNFFYSFPPITHRGLLKVCWKFNKSDSIKVIFILNRNPYKCLRGKTVELTKIYTKTQFYGLFVQLQRFF